jgi:hypothetical protein
MNIKEVLNMANKTFNNIQVFFNFLHEIQNGAWGETKQPPEVLFSNLDPNGNTNMAIELAKIYSWATEIIDFQPYLLVTTQPQPFDPTQYYKYNSTTKRYEKGTSGEAWAADTWYTLNTTNPIMIDESALPDLGHTYEFRESTSSFGAFDVREDGGAWQTISVKILDSNGKVYESKLPKYRIIKNPNNANPTDAFKLQISYNWDGAEPTWTDVSDISLGLLATSTLGKDEQGKIKSSLLPSYVDDIVEGYFNYTLLTTEPASFDPTQYYKLVDGKYVKGSAGEAWAANTWYTPHFYEEAAHTHVIEGESGKIYVDDTTGHTYRCVPGTPEVWVDISNPISAAEIYDLLGMPSNGNFDGTSHGLVPAPAAGDAGKFLKADGTWGTPTGITYSISGPTYDTNNTKQIVTLTDSNGGTSDADIVAMTGANGSTDGKAGLVPKPAAADEMKYLRGDGSWGSPVDDFPDTLILHCNNNPSIV